MPLEVGSATQLDIVVEFEVDQKDLERINGTNTTYSCNGNGRAAEREGLIAINFVCNRSSKAPDVDKAMYGSTVSILKGEKLSMRILLDHSIVESFAQGGRTCITSRIYPTTAVGEDACLFLFHNATDVGITASLQTWQMSSADVQ
ncbi:unnamed protein product [Fraxinus pennsylvanica]|uniref:Glycosyl hydrolase family 32 C-terminal domain-containing protein n=1 Tax=Fraxinus pennsylvanica TaxID=56036 RepID=A0AAD2E5I1_9LAMI|nr:unnamed protein product [Fraxinus pennsylvanica]